MADTHTFTLYQALVVVKQEPTGLSSPHFLEHAEKGSCVCYFIVWGQGNELGAVVASNMGGHSANQYQPLEHLYDYGGWLALLVDAGWKAGYLHPREALT